MAAKVSLKKAVLIGIALWLIMLVISRFSPVAAVMILLFLGVCGAMLIGLVVEIWMHRKDEDEE